ncbi:TSUP family transporter [Candidatus Spongiihabitans sp.]|uniref:TSUP family transporter n=1 Tax=Candidatus Spongiihabitans sp. TaxID=3101308 RepID=UPI003C7D26EE
MPPLTIIEWVLVCLVFVWSGFVRSGLGFGGAALAMPLMLFIIDNPLLWLPIVATHLLIFSALTVYNRLREVDWKYLKKAMLILLVPKLIGVFGLLSLPNDLLVIIIYAITFCYGLAYVFNYSFKSGNRLVDNILLVMGGYASGTSLIGAPLISAVFVRHVAIEKLRNTLFVAWMILVAIKMSAFVVFEIDLQFKYALYLLPVAAIGHYLGLNMHNRLIRDGGDKYKRMLGMVLVAICGYGLLTALA